ncbi:MAG: fatty acid desaturase family protein [Planctomycetota bacterium]
MNERKILDRKTPTGSRVSPRRTAHPPGGDAEPQNRGLLAAGILKPFVTRSDFHGWFAIAFDWAVILTCTAIGIKMDAIASDPAWWGIYPALAIIIASRMRGLENLVHEASHYNLFRTREHNQSLFQLLFATAVFRDVEDYRASHSRHHRYLGDDARDPDLRRWAGIGLDALPDRWLWLVWLRPLTGFLTLEFLATTFVEFWATKRTAARRRALLFWGTVIVVVAVFNLWVPFLIYWGLPFFVILPILRFWAELSEHTGLDPQDPLGSSRANLTLLDRWLLHPHNDGYHQVHHLSPGVPFYQLPHARRALEQRSDFLRLAPATGTLGALYTLKPRASAPNNVRDRRL